MNCGTRITIWVRHCVGSGSLDGLPDNDIGPVKIRRSTDSNNCLPLCYHSTQTESDITNPSHLFRFIVSSFVATLHRSSYALSSATSIHHLVSSSRKSDPSKLET